MARFCSSCGTEVDETAVFCPTCGQPIDDAGPAEMPAAPAWPDPAASDADASHEAHEPAREPAREPASDEPRWREADDRSAPSPPADAPTRVEQRQPPAPAEDVRRPDDDRRSSAAAAPASEPDRREASGGGLPQIDLPITMPVTLSGWLIGVGAVLAVIGLIVILIATALNAIDLLLLLALLAVAATVFGAAHLPGVPHLRLMTLIVSLIAFGVALDRIGFGGGGAGELLLFLGTAAAAIGAIILELGQDQPLGGPQR